MVRNGAGSMIYRQIKLLHRSGYLLVLNIMEVPINEKRFHDLQFHVLSTHCIAAYNHNRGSND